MMYKFNCLVNVRRAPFHFSFAAAVTKTQLNYRPKPEGRFMKHQIKFGETANQWLYMKTAYSFFRIYFRTKTA